MAEYIEREAFIKTLKKTKKDCEHYADKVCCDFAIRMVNLMPPADVQEVVRCKDCIHCCMSYDPKTNTSRQICGYVGYNPVQSSEVTDYDFCSKGERMIDSENNC